MRAGLGLRRPGAGRRRRACPAGTSIIWSWPSDRSPRSTASAIGPRSSICGPGTSTSSQNVRAHSKDLLAQVGRRRRKLEREVGPVVCEWQSTQPDDDMATARAVEVGPVRPGRNLGPLRGAVDRRRSVRRLARSRRSGLHRRAHRAAGRRPAGRRPFRPAGPRPAVVVVSRLRPGLRPVLARPDPAAGPDRRGGGAVRAGHRPGSRRARLQAAGHPALRRGGRRRGGRQSRRPP